MNIKERIRSLLSADENLQARRRWLEKTIRNLPAGQRLLDAGAGQLQNKPFCDHLNYVSQDICQYDGSGPKAGLHTGTWTTDGIDIVCDIASIPVENDIYDAVLCSEVLEHVSDPVQALAELARVTKPGGVMVLTAPFASLVHFAPYYFSTGFSRYWYEHHLHSLGFEILELRRNGSWFSGLWQEIARLHSMVPTRNVFLKTFASLYIIVGLPLFVFLRRIPDAELGCFGWHCVARKRTK